ncbi:MAG: DUF4198 domain-containing protein [Sphingomonas sp.]|uniref:DUF4198 domain-containing protein n=1 Tax=Sphingomonas sp. TaxID=28214 RepID=UPI00227581F8|nr:DUF4198 domain-containing protein [Sphingomonas sp.]MCX8475165.1 DUF4198 domain-containing protein [Sphingomonas sp.]
MKFRTPILAAAAILALAAPAAVQAHRMWMIASSTTVSGTDNWVTVDAAVSNDLFFFDHQPIRAVPAVTQPDGTPGTVENHAVGKFRATFDVHLTQQGTYRIGTVSQTVFGSYKLGGETRMIPRGTTADKLATVIPAGAADIQTSESFSRNEIYVTQGAPTTTVFKPMGKGIELVPVTHPNDLVVGEAATFQFLLDGKPAPDLFVTVIPGGIRYRDSLKQQDLKTGADGKVSINWPDPGLYWINVTPTRPREEGPGTGAPGAGGPQRPGGMAGPPQRRVSYVTTVEVLAP